MAKQDIRVQYLAHSGFSVETEKHHFIFDYIQGTVKLGDKKTFVFSSHGHSDHYNPKIFDWQEKNPDIHYILSQDISLDYDICLEHKRDHVIIMSPYDEIQVADVRIKAFSSTDLGISFLVQSEDIHLFHAGDLNWWYWWDDTPEEITKAERLYKEEIARIKGETIDIAFFPVDPRLEHNYCVGADYFIQEISPKFLIPMHFSDFEVPAKYAEERKNCSTKVIAVTKEGQETILSDHYS